MRHFLSTLLVIAALTIGACEKSDTPTPASSAPAKATSLVMPQGTSTPDGMVVGKDGKIHLCVLNLDVDAGPAVWTIDADNQFAKLIDLPAHPETGKVFPLGIAQGSDGHFYVADNQTFGGETAHKSRLLRVVMEGGKAVRVETVATGFIASNAVEAHMDRLYVTETCLINNAEPHVSGLYKFELSELDASNPVTLQPDGQDPRLLAKFTTTSPDWRKSVGANGCAITPDGVLYVCNFGEASVLTAPLKADGMLDGELKILVKGQGMGSTDGMKYLADSNKLVIADFFSNAVHVVDAKTGAVTTLAQNPNSTGAEGNLDKPSEPCLRGSTLYVSNIDLPRNGNETDDPHTVVVMPIDVK